MAVNVSIPKLGMTMTEATMMAWHVEEGQAVQKGQIIAEIETDKIAFEVEAPADGVLLKVFSQIGQKYKVGKTIAVIGAEGEPIVVPEQPGKAPVSPSARRLARELGVDVAGLEGTGPDGRIVKEDVIRAAEGTTADTAKTVAGRLEPLNATQQTVASRTQASAQTIPHVTLQATIDAGELMRARDIHRAAMKESGVKLKYINWTNDLLIHLVGRALAKDGTFNAWYEDGAIRYFDEVHIGLAIALPDGLIVPVIHNADRLSVMEIAQRRSELTAKAQARKLTADDIEGGTFSITNLGAYPVDHFSAIINAPQAAILSVGRVRQEPVVSDGAIGKAMWFSEVEDVMTSQTFDVAHVATWLQKGDVMQVDTRDVLVGSVSEEAVTHTLFTRLLEYYEGKLKVTERKERAAVREECDRMKQVLLEGGGNMYVVMSKMTEAGATPELLSSVFTFGSGPVLKRACVARVGPTVARASYRLSERGDDPGPTALQHTATQRLGLVKSDGRVHAKSATFVTPSDEKAWESWLRRPSAGRLHQFFNRLCIKAHT